VTLLDDRGNVVTRTDSRWEWLSPDLSRHELLLAILCFAASLDEPRSQITTRLRCSRRWCHGAPGTRAWAPTAFVGLLVPRCPRRGGHTAVTGVWGRAAATDRLGSQTGG
jgi:hypothetical protein